MGGSQSPEGKAQGEHARCTQKGPSWPKGILIQDLFAVRQHCSPPHQIYTHMFILTSATLQVLEQGPEKELIFFFFLFQGHDVNTNKSQPRAVISSLIHRYCVCCFIYCTNWSNTDSWRWDASLFILRVSEYSCFSSTLKGARWCGW